MNQEIIKKINLFKVEDLKKSTKIIEGYSNNCYMIELKNNQKYFYRQATINNLTPRKQEAYVANLINDQTIIWYDVKTGNMLRQWIDGSTQFEWNNDLIIEFVHKIKKLHQLEYDKSKIMIHDNNIEIGVLDEIMAQKYQQLVKKYQDLPLVFCHNDLNPGNILFGVDHRLYILDYEWSRANSIYWELANFARETLNQEQILFLIQTYGNLDKKIFADFLFITSCYALYWAFMQDQNDKKITSYIKHVYERLEVISKFIF